MTDKKIQMDFSPLQFRNVQHEFLQQFGLKTLDFYEKNVNLNNLIEYKKILNQLKTKKNSYLNIKQKNIHLQHTRGKTSQIIVNTTSPIDQTIEDQQTGFYLTQNINTFSNIRNKRNDSKDTKNSLEYSKSLIKSKIESVQQKNQNLDIDCLNDRIYGQYSVLQCLKHQQSQVQQAIFCFKKRIIALQNQFTTEEIKSKEVDRLLSQNNNQMLRAKHTNQQVKSAFLKTRKHFQLDLQGRKQIQQKFNDKNRQQFQQSIVNHIYMKKMKHRVIEQQRQLNSLDEIRHSLQKKQRKYNFIYKKQQQLYKTYQQIKQLSPNDFLKRPIVSILDKQFQQFDQQYENNQQLIKKVLNKQQAKLSKPKINSKQQLSNKQKQKPLKAIKIKGLNQVVQEIINLHHQAKQKQNNKINEFKLLINQRDEKQEQYNKVLSKIVQNHEILFQKVKIQNPQDKKKLEDLSAQISQILKKLSFINNSSNGIQQRLKFYLSKQINIMLKIIDLWLKNDKISNKQIELIQNKFNQVVSLFSASNINHNSSSQQFNNKNSCYQQIQQKQMCLHDSKALLVNYFQNWKNYMGFLDIMHQSLFIYRFMNKNKLSKLFKRIIKTKLINKQIPTQDIFEKAIDISFQQGRFLHLQRVKGLIEIFKQLYGYLNKVMNGNVRLNCALNYQIMGPQQNQQTDLSKIPSRNQLQRNSYNRQSNNSNNHNNERYSIQIKQEGKKSQLMSDLNKHSNLFKNIKNEDIISKLKKKRPINTLNIHQFYQNLREQIQKVNKISTY